MFDPSTSRGIINISIVSGLAVCIIYAIISGIWKKIWSRICAKYKQIKERRKVKKLDKETKEKHDMMDKKYEKKGPLYIEVDGKDNVSYCPRCYENGYDVQKMKSLHNRGQFRCVKCGYTSPGLF